MNIISQHKTLTKAIVIASLSASGMTTLPTYAAISMDADEKAALVEKRLQHINEQSAMLLDRLTAHPFVDEVVYSHSPLQHDQASQSATTTGELVLTLSEDQIDLDAIKLTFSDSIDYSDALNQEDVLARVKTKFTFKEGSEALEELSEEERKSLLAYFDRMELRTDLLEGTSFKQYINLPEIDAKEDEVEVKFDGMKVQASYDEETFMKGVGDVRLEMGQLSVSEMQEDIDYDALMALPQEEQDNLAYEDYPVMSELVNVLDMQPFSMDYSVSENGDIQLDSSPIAISFDDHSDGVVIERVTGEGKVTYDEDIAQYLGKQHYTAHNLTIESYDLPMPIVLEKIDYIIELDRAEKDMYDMQATFNVTPEASTFDALTEGMFAIQSLNIGFSGKNLSQETLNQIMTLNSHVTDVELEFNDESLELVESILRSLSNNGAEAGSEMTLSTDKGDVTFDSNVHLREGANAKAWTDAFDNEDTATLEQLVKNDLLFDVKLAVPVALLDAVGMTEMAEIMAAPYVIREDDHLNVHVQNKGDGTLVNGQPLETL